MHLQFKALICNINLRVQQLISVHFFLLKVKINLIHCLFDLFFRKKCSKAEKSDLVEKILKLIAGHSHEVSILYLIKTKTLESFWTHLDYY